jgi:hypothetical protein
MDTGSREEIASKLVSRRSHCDDQIILFLDLQGFAIGFQNRSGINTVEHLHIW